MRATVSSAAVRLVPADSIDFDALVRLFNEAYSDYAVPLRLDRAALEFTIAACDIDLASSRVALDDGDPAAFAFLAIRDDEGWIGGMGTVPERRRRGLGEAALSTAIDEARLRGVASVRLEVIDDNAPAHALYEKLGFRVERDFVVWALDGSPAPAGGTRSAPEEDAHAWIAANRPSPEPWQRADETLERWRPRGLELEGLVVEGDGETVGALVYRPRPEAEGAPPGVMQIAARDADAAEALLATVAGQNGGFRLLNAPAGEPPSLACERLGARPEVRQHEMRLTL
jgi:ribosomal protein S18 acetylase RimI-like enzyme